MNWTHFKGDSPLTMESVRSLWASDEAGVEGASRRCGSAGQLRAQPLFLHHTHRGFPHGLPMQSRTWLDPGTDAQISSGPRTVCHSAKDK